MDPKIELYAKICTAMDQPDAKAAVWEILADYNISATTASTSLQDSIDDFLAAKRADNLSEKSIKNYRIILGSFRQWLDLPPNQITTDHIRRWLSYLKEERGLKKGSVQTYLNCLRSFFGWLHSEEKIQCNPMNRIRSAHIDKKKTRQPLTQEEVERCRAVLETPRERAIFELYLSTGCRVNELVSVPTNSVDFQARTIEVHGKGDKTRTVYFSVRAKLAVQAYLAASPNDAVLFSCKAYPHAPLGSTSIEKIIKDIGKRAGLADPLHPHKLRHTFATSALNAGMDIVVIQQLLGHSNLDTTQIYAELSQENVRHSYNKMIA